MEREILYRYFEGAATEAEQTAIREWAQASPENYKSYTEARQLWCALLLYAKPEQTRKTVFWAKPLRYVAGLTAAVILFIGIAVLCYTGLNSYAGGLQQISVPRGQRVELTLADGSKVWLNSTSKLEFSPFYGIFNRNVRLSGEGYFDVAEGTIPFVVTTQNYDVKVHGTVFNVYAFDNKPTFETSLIEGVVEVMPHNGGASVMLHPNQMAVSTADGSLQSRPLKDIDRLLWINGIISLNNVTLGEMMECFGNYFDTDIKILNPELYNVRCTGKFRQDDGLDHSLRVVQNLVNFQFRHDLKNHSVEIY